MPPESLAVLARLTYLRAVAAARVAPTPRRWRKLVMAAKNLRTANAARDRRRLAALSPAARRLASVPGDGRRGAVLLAFPAHRRGEL